MSSYPVYLLPGAQQDLLELHKYVTMHDSLRKADGLIENLYKVCLRLTTMPDSGRVPPELQRIGSKDFKEIILKPYRVIYKPTKNRVLVYCILDGRRDLQDLLAERLLR